MQRLLTGSLFSYALQGQIKETVNTYRWHLSCQQIFPYISQPLYWLSQASKLRPGLHGSRGPRALGCGFGLVPCVPRWGLCIHQCEGWTFSKTPFSFILVPHYFCWPFLSRNPLSAWLLLHWTLQILLLLWSRLFSSLLPLPHLSSKLLDNLQQFIHRLCFHLEQPQLPAMSPSAQVLSKSHLQPEVPPSSCPPSAATLNYVPLELFLPFQTKHVRSETYLFISSHHCRTTHLFPLMSLPLLGIPCSMSGFLLSFASCVYTQLPGPSAWSLKLFIAFHFHC